MAYRARKRKPKPAPRLAALLQGQRIAEATVDGANIFLEMDAGAHIHIQPTNDGFLMATVSYPGDPIDVDMD